MALDNSPGVDGADHATPRKVTSLRGGKAEPEAASPRFVGPKRGKYPKSPFPAVDFPSPRGTGDSQENTMIHRTVEPLATRPTPKADTSDPTR